MLEWFRDGVWLDGAGNLLLGVATAFGIVFGWRKARPKTEEHQRIEVAGALIDGSDARALKNALVENTAALAENTRATIGVSRAADRMERVMDKLTDEMIRGQGPERRR